MVRNVLEVEGVGTSQGMERGREAGGHCHGQKESKCRNEEFFVGRKGLEELHTPR